MTFHPQSPLLNKAQNIRKTQSWGLHKKREKGGLKDYNTTTLICLKQILADESKSYSNVPTKSKKETNLINLISVISMFQAVERTNDSDHYESTQNCVTNVVRKKNLMRAKVSITKL